MNIIKLIKHNYITCLTQFIVSWDLAMLTWYGDTAMAANPNIAQFPTLATSQRRVAQSGKYRPQQSTRYRDSSDVLNATMMLSN